jgi:hypothetical protein
MLEHGRRIYLSSDMAVSFSSLEKQSASMAVEPALMPNKTDLRLAAEWACNIDKDQFRVRLPMSVVGPFCPVQLPVPMSANGQG